MVVADGEKEKKDHGDPDDENATTPNTTIVLLLMGLPAAGKSSLARALVSQWNATMTNVSTPPAVLLEYDQIQEDVLLENLKDTSTSLEMAASATVAPSDSDHSQEEQDNDVLQAWRQSRTKARQDLHDLIQQQSTSTTVRRHLVVVDDNSFLRSMRKQVYQTCQSLVNNNKQDDSPRPIYFGIVWLDTSVDVCLARNPHRPRPVPESVIRSMHTRLEAPCDSYYWERCVLHLDGGNTMSSSSPKTLVETAWTFLQRDVLASQPIPPPVDKAAQVRRLEEEQAQTAASVWHQVDQALRQCVQTVARRQTSLARTANEVRKQVYAQAKQQQTDQEDLMTVAVQAFWKNLQERLQQPDGSSQLSNEEWARLQSE